MAKKTETDVTGVIEKNVKYLAKPTNSVGFRNYADLTVGSTFRTKAEREAFSLGVKLSGLNSRFNPDREAGLVAEGETFEAYVLRSTGVAVPTGEAARSALSAGIAYIRKYGAWRTLRDNGKIDPVTGESLESDEADEPTE